MEQVKAERVRFKRTQKFRLSSRGSEAAAAYAVMLKGVQAGGGRAHFDAARDAWGASRGLAAEDGLFLVEFGERDRTVAEAARSLESCGTTAAEVKAAVERLVGSGMLEAVLALPEPPPPPPRYRW